MIAFAIGIAAVGLFAIRRHHRRHLAWCHHGAPWGYGHGGGGDDGSLGGPRWRGGRPWRRLAFLYDQLDTTPGQERVIQREVRGLMMLGRAQRRGLRDARADLGRALAGDQVDQPALEAALARGDAAWAELRAAAAASLVQIHGVLDSEQRAQLGRYLGAAPGGAPFR
ncbi:MAG: periplasmic heavy metal sensor [Kofleriaceae bacterium]